MMLLKETIYLAFTGLLRDGHVSKAGVWTVFMYEWCDWANFDRWLILVFWRLVRSLGVTSHRRCVHVLLQPERRARCVFIDTYTLNIKGYCSFNITSRHIESCCNTARLTSRHLTDGYSVVSRYKPGENVWMKSPHWGRGGRTDRKQQQVGNLFTQHYITTATCSLASTDLSSARDTVFMFQFVKPRFLSSPPLLASIAVRRQSEQKQSRNKERERWHTGRGRATYCETETDFSLHN